MCEKYMFEVLQVYCVLLLYYGATLPGQYCGLQVCGTIPFVWEADYVAFERRNASEWT